FSAHVYFCEGRWHLRCAYSCAPSTGECANCATPQGSRVRSSQASNRKLSELAHGSPCPGIGTQATDHVSTLPSENFRLGCVMLARWWDELREVLWLVSLVGGLSAAGIILAVAAAVTGSV